ncbi:MAG: ABC transporter permease, partial [Vampirovibrionia bacterium]
EKDSKIIEVLLSSVTTEELLTGKMVGLGIAGLIQASVWLLFMAIPLSVGTVYFQVSFLNIFLYFVYIILGFMLYGSVMAGIGSIGYDSKQAAQLAGFCSAISVLPLLFMPILVLHPNGWISKLLSFFPFTSSVTMMVRISTDKLNYADILISILILIPSIYLIIKLSAKVFRTAILMYGKKITLREIYTWIKS